MGDFILISRSSAEVGQPDLSQSLREAAQAAQMTVSFLTPAAWLVRCGPLQPKLVNFGPWTLVGEVINRQSAVAGVSSDQDDDLDYERKLLARVWGRYVGLRFAPGGTLSSLLRDPSGAMDCLVWEQSGVTVVASFIPDWLLRGLRPDWSINFKRLGQFIRRPLLTTGELMLDGPVAVLPGSVQSLPLGSAPRMIWQPCNFARRSLGPWPSADQAADILVKAVDEAVEGLAGLGGPVAAEVSGGLDSSLIAASLLKSERPVAAWLNAYGPNPESDERSYVAALGEALKISPRSVPHAIGPITAETLERLSLSIRPPLNAMDIHHDLAWCAELEKAGACALMTGKGGDSILVQAITAEVFADLWKARGPATLFSSEAFQLSTVNEASLWSLVQASRPPAMIEAPPTLFESLLCPLDEARRVHPWLTDLDAFGPAKARQIAGVADSVSRHGPSLLTDRFDVRHPLCAQPVIEACLSLPISVLTKGTRDRGLARWAFRDRLPRRILERRSKGDMSRIYGQMILNSLPFLRPYLLEGRLVETGILDWRATEAALTREQLTWQGRYAAIMMAVAFEAWVRGWEARLGGASEVR